MKVVFLNIVNVTISDGRDFPNARCKVDKLMIETATLNTEMERQMYEIGLKRKGIVVVTRET